VGSGHVVLHRGEEYDRKPHTLTVLRPVASAGDAFIMDEKTYVALTDGQGQWVVIAKYPHGERFEDQCYLHMATRGIIYQHT
jgi:hypothetical protein